MKENTFILAKNTYLGKLRMFVPIVDRVHGKHHPEFHDVRRIFETLDTKITRDDDILDLEFKALKDITKNYSVPSDVCESYEAVYDMLEALNEAYDAHKGIK